MLRSPVLESIHNFHLRSVHVSPDGGLTRVKLHSGLDVEEADYTY